MTLADQPEAAGPDRRQNVLFGWLNRWNDTMATDLEDEPLGFGLDHLAARGWEPGKHAHT